MEPIVAVRMGRAEERSVVMDMAVDADADVDIEMAGLRSSLRLSGLVVTVTARVVRGLIRIRLWVRA
jgi:hypothetical protein